MLKLYKTALIDILSSSRTKTSSNGGDPCVFTDSQMDLLTVLEIVNIVLFSLIGLVWIGSLVVIFKTPVRINKRITTLLYIIMLGIIALRLVQILTLNPPVNSLIGVLTGCISTYLKIGLGCCQLVATQEILKQTKLRIAFTDSTNGRSL